MVHLMHFFLRSGAGSGLKRVDLGCFLVSGVGTGGSAGGVMAPEGVVSTGRLTPRFQAATPANRWDRDMLACLLCLGVHEEGATISCSPLSFLTLLS
jgi:hypothetical protein